MLAMLSSGCGTDARTPDDFEPVSGIYRVTPLFESTDCASLGEFVAAPRHAAVAISGSILSVPIQIPTEGTHQAIQRFDLEAADSVWVESVFVDHGCTSSSEELVAEATSGGLEVSAIFAWAQTPECEPVVIEVPGTCELETAFFFELEEECEPPCWVIIQDGDSLECVC